MVAWLFGKVSKSLPKKELSPHYADTNDIQACIEANGFCVLDTANVLRLTGCTLAELNGLASDWSQMPQDNYLKDGGHYRRRRHSCFVFEDYTLSQVPHRAHWQSLDYNALHGGMDRLFEPVLDTTIAKPAWTRILSALSQKLTDMHQPLNGKWCIEAHQFRIDTSDGIGRPTPEGAHRDGVNFVAVFMVGRNQIKGGETRVFEADGPRGQRFTLDQAWSLLLLDDTRMIHESTPIQPLAESGHRDTLVVTFRENSFQSSPS